MYFKIKNCICSNNSFFLHETFVYIMVSSKSHILKMARLQSPKQNTLFLQIDMILGFIPTENPNKSTWSGNWISN